MRPATTRDLWEQLAQTGLSASALSIELGVAASTLTRWRDGTTPRGDLVLRALIWLDGATDKPRPSVSGKEVGVWAVYQVHIPDAQSVRRGSKLVIGCPPDVVQMRVEVVRPGRGGARVVAGPIEQRWP